MEKRSSWVCAAAVLFIVLSAASSSGAATQSCTVITNRVRCEGEIFSVDPSVGVVATGANPAVTSGGGLLRLEHNGSATLTANLPSTTGLIVRARGGMYCERWPHMLLAVDGKLVLSQTVASSGWISYPVAVKIAGGSHTLTVTYDNDSASSTCANDLRLDYIDLTSESTSMPSADLPGWHLVLSDDFPGTSLDLTKWYAPYDSPSRHWRPQQVTVHDGVLDIDAARQADGYWWSSGVNGGRGLKQTYGKYLVRARFDAGRGISDAMMLWPTGGVCDWPPEIDFSESGGEWATSRTGYSGFYHYRNPGCGQDGHVSLGQAPSVDYTQWHTIGVEWTPGKLVYTLDGQPWATSTDLNIAQFNTINGELVLQSQACNGSSCTDMTTPLHVHLIVDWVAIYAYRPLG
jgi:hypothetical protein